MYTIQIMFSTTTRNLLNYEIVYIINNNNNIDFLYSAPFSQELGALYNSTIKTLISRHNNIKKHTIKTFSSSKHYNKTSSKQVLLFQCGSTSYWNNTII